jgi:hypothetical protein
VAGQRGRAGEEGRRGPCRCGAAQAVISPMYVALKKSEVGWRGTVILLGSCWRGQATCKKGVFEESLEILFVGRPTATIRWRYSGARIARYPFYNFYWRESGTIGMVAHAHSSQTSHKRHCRVDHAHSHATVLYLTKANREKTYQRHTTNDHDCMISSKHKGTSDYALQAPPLPPQSYPRPFDHPGPQASACSACGTTPTAQGISRQT